MKKRTTVLAVILAVILVLVLAAVAMFSFTSGNNPSDNSNVPPDDPMWHGNGMEELPIPVEDTDENTGDDTPGKVEEQPKVYTLMCRFEGKIDANSFEVTELDTNTETGEFVDGPIMQLRVGNESVRQDVNVLEIGENITIIFTYNEDSQPVADRIMFLSR